jgi:superfamily II DNA or RNA helicase
VTEILPFASPAPVTTGDLVRAREATWRVLEVRPFARARVVRLVGADAGNRWQPCTLIEPFDRLHRLDSADRPRVVSRPRWMRTLAALMAATPAPGCPATVAGAQVALMPHQIQPLLAILRGESSRLLLADGVGLGKTIEAALILRELSARGCADRVLILVPSGLREQWQQELSQRAGLRSTIVDANTLAVRTRELPPDVNPWTLAGIHLVSLDFIKQEGVLRGADRVAWDLLVVDEAHGLNEGTDRVAAVETLARHSRFVVLLTATPHHGSDEAFAALCRIGCTAREQDRIAIFRRTRAVLGVALKRRVHILRVALTRQELWLHALLARYARRVERDGLPGEGASLAISVLMKRASSSASSLERSLRRRLAFLQPAEHPGAVQSALPLAFEHELDSQDGDDPEDREPAHVLANPGLRTTRLERAWLTLLIEAARNAARVESKPRALVRWLRRAAEPALVYTEYRDTLAQVACRLPPDLSHAMLHGGLAAEARRVALGRFASGDARVLLATDAAGEGLNLHHRCRLVFTVELPWNPNRLEQRIGRVDRLGQTRTVHIVHLVAAATSEEHMLDRLTDRLRQIGAALGDVPAVLDPAAHASIVTNALPAHDGRDSSAARLAASELYRMRAMQSRAWRPSRRPGHTSRLTLPHADPLVALDRRAPLVCVARARWQLELTAGQCASGLLCIWRTRPRGDRRTRSPRLVAVDIACEVPGNLRHKALVAFVLSTVARCRQRIDEILDGESDAAAFAIDEAERPWRERLAMRDAAIRAALRARAGGPHQPMLFDDLAAERALDEAARLRHTQLPRTRSSSSSGAADDADDHDPTASDHAHETSAPSASSERALVLVLVVR